MSEQEKEQLLAECVEDYHRHRARREVVDPESYRDRLGEHHEEFLEILEAEEALDRAVRLAPDEPFPRPFGQYTLTRELGRGAAGVVYEAVHRPLGRRVAIKVLRTGFDTEPVALERFRQEARACAQIRHPNIVEIYEAGEVEGRPYYAMPMLEGESLAALVRKGEVPEPRTLCRNLAGIADALAELHRNGIVHRDIKPSNIMVEPDGRMVLADFGLARSESAQTLTRTGQALGTPLYMSPEQLLGRRDAIDGRTDVYGMGVTLYEALTGQTPFVTDNLTALMQMILTERARSVREVAPEVPRECANIAMKAMEQRRADRYESAEALREDLLNFADGEPVSGRPVSPLRVFLRRRSRHLVAAAVLLIAVVALAAWPDTRPALLQVACFPPAEVMVDGEAVGTTPVEVELPAGDHEVVLRHRGFEPRSQRVSLEAGATRSIETVIVARDPEDPEALRRIGEELQLAFHEFEPDRFRSGSRGSLALDGASGAKSTGGRPPPVHVLYPRDTVLSEDLTTARVDLADVMYVPDGVIRFCRGEEILHEVPYDPQDVVTELAIPAAVRERLEPGDEVVWGYFPRTGQPATAAFRLLGREEHDEFCARLAEIESRLEGQPAAVIGHLRTQFFLNHGLDSAALREAHRLCERNADSVRGWAAVQEAARRLGLRATGLAREARGHLDRLGVERPAGEGEEGS